MQHTTEKRTISPATSDAPRAAFACTHSVFHSRNKKTKKPHTTSHDILSYNAGCIDSTFERLVLIARAPAGCLAGPEHARNDEFAIESGAEIVKIV